jgi:hypothetical protein
MCKVFKRKSRVIVITSRIDFLPPTPPSFSTQSSQTHQNVLANSLLSGPLLNHLH